MQYVLSAYYCCVEWTLGCLRLNSLEHQFSRVGCYIRDSKDGSGTNGSQTLTQFDNLAVEADVKLPHGEGELAEWYVVGLQCNMARVRIPVESKII